MDAELTKLKQQLNPLNLKENEPLSKHTTLKIGGPADLWYEPKTTEELIGAVKVAHELNVPVTMVGWGANILVSDKGIRGLVIRNKNKGIKISDKAEVSETEELETDVQARWDSASEGASFKYEFKDLDYDESDQPRVEVTMDSGVDLPFATNYLIQQGLTGLQWYARIPGTVGGCVFNNIHGGSHFISEVVKSVKVIDNRGEVKNLTKAEMMFDYDYSILHKTKDVILDVTFSLYQGDKERAKAAALEWAKRKSIQPNNSPGCTFANLSNADKERLGYPTTGIGYVVEHVLKMSGYHVGDAAISTAHHNFIVNNGSATAQDFLEVVKTIASRTQSEIGVKLVPEIFFLGFEPEEIADLY
jgi:UDP-N-acetylmuramate dehydrogenase